MDYHRLHKHGERPSAPAEISERPKDAAWIIVLVGALLFGLLIWLIVAASDDDGPMPTSSSVSSANGSGPVQRDLDRDLERVDALRTHTQAWNASAEPLVAALVDQDVSIEETVEVAERELPIMKRAAEGVAVASLDIEDREVARLVGAIGRNYQQKYATMTSLVNAMERQDDEQLTALGERLDELVTAAQDLARELLAYVREQGYELEFDVAGDV